MHSSSPPTADRPFDSTRGGVSGRSFNPFRALLDLFSSVRLGIVLLTLLFLYSSIGSAGLPTRIWIFDPAAWTNVAQLPWFEMTEFEWFHWWPFDVLIALICLNITTTTLRRIPLNTINLGVWMIHTGIIILALGSVWYFSTKVEGDAPVGRRLIRASLEGADGGTVTFAAQPGKVATIGRGENMYVLHVQAIDPEWELLSGDDKGKRAYKVTVAVQGPKQQFMRELLAGYPQYTEDVIRTENPQQPFMRAKKVLGEDHALVDQVLGLSLDLSPQEDFYLVKTSAIYLREVGAERWVQRPLRGAPRYNDYIASADDVFLDPGQRSPEPRLMSVEVPPVDPADPLPDVTLTVSRYLRYARLESRRRPAPEANHLDPVVSLRLIKDEEESELYQFIAFDPQNNNVKDIIRFRWVNTPEELQALQTFSEPSLRIRIPGTETDVAAPIRATVRTKQDLEFTPVEGTDYSYRVREVNDNLQISGTVLSLAIVEIRRGETTFQRWVFSDASFNRDLPLEGSPAAHSETPGMDAGIDIAYTPGNAPAPLTIVAGPAESDLGVIWFPQPREARHQPIAVGEVIPVQGGLKLKVERYAARTVSETKPRIVPREQRDRDAQETFSLIKVDMPTSDGTQSDWLRFHMYAFASPTEVLRRHGFSPAIFKLPDGRLIEMMYSRERLPLPAPVALEDFKVASHVGGFTGQSSSIMDWTSMIRFAQDGGWTDAVPVSVNKPWEHGGYSFFQAQWDPPDPARAEGEVDSAGRNYTVLGVGNRNGVTTQLLGCCIAVIGMIYAFYVKPMIKRRRQQAVYEQVRREQGRAGKAQPRSEQVGSPEPVGAAWKVQP